MSTLVRIERWSNDLGTYYEMCQTGIHFVHFLHKDRIKRVLSAGALVGYRKPVYAYNVGLINYTKCFSCLPVNRVNNDWKAILFTDNPDNWKHYADESICVGPVYLRKFSIIGLAEGLRLIGKL